MLSDDTYPGRIALQPETDEGHERLDELLDIVSDAHAHNPDLVAFYTAEIPDYPGLSADVQAEADSWMDTGYRALVISWESTPAFDDVEVPIGAIVEDDVQDEHARGSENAGKGVA